MPWGRKKGERTDQGDRQRERVYAALVAYIEQHGYPPSIRDLARELHMAHSHVAYHLDVLEADGVIRRDRFVSRGIRVVK